MHIKEGGLRFSALRIWPIFGPVFRFLHLKTVVFSSQVGVLRGLRVFSTLDFGFRFCRQ